MRHRYTKTNYLRAIYTACMFFFLIKPNTDCTDLLSDLSQQGSHLQSQFLVDREVSRHNGLISLISQQQPLPL